MKKTISTILAMCMISNVALADCNFATDIETLPDGRRAYSKECHIKVGEMKRDLEIANKQVETLNKAIELKDLAMAKSNERVELWMNTTYKLEDRLNKIDSLQSKNNWIMFGLGVVVTGAAVWGAGQLVRK